VKATLRNIEFLKVAFTNELRTQPAHPWPNAGTLER